MQGQSSIARRSLIIRPGKIEVLRCNAPDRCGIPLVKPDHGAPDVRRWTSVVDKERVGPTATNQEVRTGAAIKHVSAAVDSDRIVSIAGVDEPVGRKRTDIQVVAVDVDVFV